MRYRHDREKGILKVDQTAYIQKLIERFDLMDIKLHPDKVTPLPALNAAKDLETAMGKITQIDIDWMNAHPGGGLAQIQSTEIPMPSIGATSGPGPYSWSSGHQQLEAAIQLPPIFPQLVLSLGNYL